MKPIVLLLLVIVLLASCDVFFDEEASRNSVYGKLYCLEVLQEKHPDLHFEFIQTSQLHSIGCLIRFSNGAYMDANEYLLNQVICDN
jgi:hypothetical protein